VWLVEFALRSLGDGVMVVDRDGAIRYANPAAEPLRALVPQLLAGRHAVHANRVFAGVVTTHEDQRVIAIRDVTDHCIATRRAELAQRRSELGIYASSIAHQINNPLAIINVHAELMKEDLTSLRSRYREEGKRFGDISDSMVELETAVIAITKITGDMRAFSQPTAQASADLRRAIEWAAKTAGPDLRDRARVICRLDADGPVVLDELGLGRVVLELVRNAAAAIEPGSAERNEISIVTHAAGTRVAIEIRDTGCGIAEQRLATIFDPAISVDAAGAPRIGVGLAECKELVEAVGGEITLESVADQGTVVRVELPRR
jgi:two-component system NtrC family sensor kinase